MATRAGNPAVVIAAAFAGGVAAGTGLLMLPAATAAPEGSTFLDALFTATSAVCVTGLTTVDTGTHWSPFGHVVLAALMQVGGLSIMTVASLLVVLVSRRLGLRARLVAQAQSGSLDLSDVRRVLLNVVLFSLAGEALTALVLGLRLGLGYDVGAVTAVWEGLFHAVSAFNNGGFVLWPDGMAGFAGDPWMLLPVALAVIVGGLGFPVIFELVRSHRPRTWSVTTRITVVTSAALLVVGTVLYTAMEYGNPATLGPMGVADKLLAGFFSSVMPRSGGFSAVDVGSMTPESWLVTDVLMFIGGGSASTAGGIKVTTFGLLALVLWAEMRSEADVDVGPRRIPEANQRQALAVALLGLGLAVVATFVLSGVTPHPTERVVFEVLSALGTVGLTTGITTDLPDVAEILLVVLMFVGRLGPLALASALALRERPRRYRRPEERTIIG
ncbi:potassium transporter TrkG [Actinomycetospora corticicola]|uniref:Potassium uptake TrkH family protein n=1 Tax=Actinomycetospora corticicola TaxID=663602 RepID=A0A7Y9DT27_9PSEU|nr:potassium transporter TrkG [Actinomycetospora corticicola]NYD34953.1 potassium uptake TrkH family protein [Actinomycetospora corticicola]